MYLLITRNNPYIEELNKNPQNQAFQKDFEGMEIDLKSRFKAHELDIKDRYTLDNNNNSEDNSYSEEEDTSKGSSLSLATAKLKPSQLGREDETLLGKQSNILKISKYKTYIQILDIVSSILVITAAILCQIENENYYKSNIYRRVVASLIINYIDLNEGNNTWAEIFSDRNVNLTALIEYEGVSLPTMTYHFIKNSIANGNQRGYVTQIKNSDLLEAYNITADDFNYRKNEDDYSKIIVPLQVDQSDQNMRYAILILTLLGGALILLSRYVEHIRVYYLIKENEVPFYKKKYFLFLLIEFIILVFFQYPSMNSYAIYSQLDCIMVLPTSSLLSAFSIFRLIYVLKIINSITIWHSQLAENICDKYDCSAGPIFSFKAIQKSNPFLSLIVLFFLSCIIFGFFIRIFELYYWETQRELTQNWRYHWNALWCVFVSMTTVGYGDFYPRTHFGRVIIIIACVVGVYFISMMMIFMTQKSLLSETEQKAYKLITRLKLRSQLKEVHSKMIYHAINMAISTKRFNEKTIEDKEYKIKFNYEKRCVISIIDENKVITENIKSFDIIPTKEQLYDISERIEIDIKEIKGEIDILQKMNTSLMGYTDTQVVMMKYLKKCITSTKLMYDLIEKKPEAFGDLKNLDKNEMMDEMEKTFKESCILNNCNNCNKGNGNDCGNEQGLFDKNTTCNINAGRRRTNPNQFDDLTHEKNYDEYYAEELAKYQVSPDKFKEHFNSLFFDTSENSKKAMKSNALKTIKTIKAMKDMKKKIDAELLLKRGGGGGGGGNEKELSDNTISEQRSNDE